MITSWFLIVTLCAVDINKPGHDCDDYVIDGGMTYTDCRDALGTFPEKPGLYSLRCDKGESVDTGGKLSSLK